MWRHSDPFVSPTNGTAGPTGGAVIVHADGGSRGNPGPAGYGAVVLDRSGSVLAERFAALGVATNNVAEYAGLIAGLEAARDVGASVVTARLDSKLVVEQMSGRWKIKHADLKPLAARAAALVANFARVDFEWVPRAENAHADRLANQAMDDAARSGTAGTGGTARSSAVGPSGATDASGATDPADGTGASGATDPADGTGATRATGATGNIRGIDRFGRPDPAVDPAAVAPAVPLPSETANGATRVVVVRHGQTTWGAEMRFAGRQDVPLTGRGRRQATAVAKRISALAPTRVLTSPLQRCTSTAQAIAEHVGATVAVDERLIDGLLGDWTGFRADQIAEQWPRQFAAWRSDPDAAPPGGESFTGIRQRVAPVVDDVVARHRSTTIVLVTHAAPAKMILASALGTESAVAYRLRIDTGSLSGFTVQPDGAVMVWAVNETGHLVG